MDLLSDHQHFGLCRKIGTYTGVVEQIVCVVGKRVLRHHITLMHTGFNLQPAG